MARPSIDGWTEGSAPNLLARILNSMWAAMASVGAGYRWPRRLPKNRGTWSMLGDNAQWVQNVRAAGGKAVIRSGDFEKVWHDEIPPTERVPATSARRAAATLD